MYDRDDSTFWKSGLIVITTSTCSWSFHEVACGRYSFELGRIAIKMGRMVLDMDTDWVGLSAKTWSQTRADEFARLLFRSREHLAVHLTTSSWSMVSSHQTSFE
jgi:hypothetical protein